MEDRGANGSLTPAGDACRRFDADLEAYLDGQVRPGVEPHAAECVFCGAVLADLRLIRAESAQLEHDDPPARLWANVRAALAEEHLIRSGRKPFGWAWILRPVPAAALAGLLLGGSMYFLRTSGVLRRETRVAHRAMALVDPSMAESVAKMEQAFRARTVSLDPNVKVAYEKDLNSLDVEIQECNDSLAQQPDDMLAREYLASAYTEKARVLASALELGDGNAQ